MKQTIIQNTTYQANNRRDNTGGGVERERNNTTIHLVNVMSVFRRATEVGREEGILTLFAKIPPYIYQQIWPYLPDTRNIIKNEIRSSQNKKVTDKFLPAYLTQYAPTDSPDYEERYISSIRQYISEGEKVVVVGGGEGISTVVTAKQVQSSGKVDVFEGGSREVKKTKETVDINGVSGIVTVHHAIVSNAYSLRSSAGDAKVVSPSELPECDTLAIDADGAEIPILEGVSIRPNKLIVEHHAVSDDDELVVEYQPDKMRSLIQNLGYEIVEEVSYEGNPVIFVAKRK